MCMSTIKPNPKENLDQVFSEFATSVGFNPYEEPVFQEILREELESVYDDHSFPFLTLMYSLNQQVKNGTIKDEDLKKELDAMYDAYISNKSRMKIKIDSTMINSLMDAKKEEGLKLEHFNDAIREVQKLIKQNAIVRLDNESRKDKLGVAYHAFKSDLKKRAPNAAQTPKSPMSGTPSASPPKAVPAVAPVVPPALGKSTVAPAAAPPRSDPSPQSPPPRPSITTRVRGTISAFEALSRTQSSPPLSSAPSPQSPTNKSDAKPVQETPTTPTALVTETLSEKEFDAEMVKERPSTRGTRETVSAASGSNKPTASNLTEEQVNALKAKHRNPKDADNQRKIEENRRLAENLKTKEKELFKPNLNKVGRVVQSDVSKAYEDARARRMETQARRMETQKSKKLESIQEEGSNPPDNTPSTRNRR